MTKNVKKATKIPRMLHWALCRLDEEYWNTFELKRPVGLWLHKDLHQIPLPFVDIFALGIIYYHKERGLKIK